MLFNEIETCRSTVTRKPKVDFQKRSTFDRNQNRPCDPIKETRGRSSKTHTFIHEMKMTRATVPHLRGVAGQNLRGFSMWHRTDRAPKKSRQLHRSILKKSTVAWFSTISKRAVRVYQGSGASSVKNTLFLMKSKSPVRVYHGSRWWNLHLVRVYQCLGWGVKWPVRQCRGSEGSNVKNTRFLIKMEIARSRVACLRGVACQKHNTY